MSRNFITQAIVLKINRIGEIHKGLTLLTRDLGIISAIAHGAWKMKSRLRAFTQLFSVSKMYLYYNPINQSYKVSDAESLLLNEAAASSLKKYYVLSVCTEIILKSYGGGESFREIFSLFLEVLKTIEKSREEDADLILIQFLFRFLAMTGHKVDVLRCDNCGKEFSTEKDQTARQNVFYTTGSTGFVCAGCRGSNPVPVFSGMIKYLSATTHIPLTRALGYRIESRSVEILKQILFGIIEIHLETRLKSVEKGEGIV
jgi:DNA repair protein RecO (recombination protein O)